MAIFLGDVKSVQKTGLVQERQLRFQQLIAALGLTRQAAGISLRLINLREKAPEHAT